MASTLKINTLTGVSTAGSIAVTGEGNSTTTNLQQGLAKCWIDFNLLHHIPQTIASMYHHYLMREQGKIGQTNISNDMANINYSMTQGCRMEIANGTKIFQNGAKSVGSLQLYTTDRDGGAFDIAIQWQQYTEI